MLLNPHGAGRAGLPQSLSLEIMARYGPAPRNGGWYRDLGRPGQTGSGVVLLLACLLAVGLALMFLLTASAHFNRIRPDLVRMVPPSFPNPEFLVTVTGVAKFAGAVGLLMAATAPWAAYGLIAMLVAMFPANVYAAHRHLTLAGRPATPLALRVPLQILWIGLLWWSVQRM